METNQNIDKNYVLAKVWNDILGDDILPDNLSTKCIDLQNCAFRFNLLINSKGKNRQLESNEKVDELIRKCNQLIIKNSKLDGYLKQNHEETCSQRQKNSDTELIEILENSSSEQVTQENEEKMTYDVIQDTNQEQEKMGKPNKAIQTSISIEQIISKLNSMIKAITNENSADLKQNLSDIANNFDLNSVEILCLNLLNIENFKPGCLIYTNTSESPSVTLKENELVLFFECLIQLNTSINLLSFNISNAFFKSVLSSYILSSVNASTSNEQLSFILSRRILILCSNLLKEFPRQFIQSCLIQWIIEANLKNLNKIFIEFILKIIKENFTEQDSIILIQNLLMDFSGLKWSDNIYSVLSNLIEKISNLNLESFGLILNKMKNDSFELSKSTIFSKFLLLLLNKFKSNLVVSVSTNHVNNLNESFSTMSQSSQSKRVRTTAIVETVSYNKNLIDIIESIVENNQTLIKKTLLNLIKSFKC
ncbi:unnamed protein product [Brachionus calyciflorus]|uniref:Fanconi Anaemia group E protein C-terminal domain-containing protein n=1 Tax=Brachionus calyciflorus TaxID=104777 RepID=A0A813QWT5_9BILA|nr:unnamed protein product [Brachionus calyciflorus]